MEFQLTMNFKNIVVIILIFLRTINCISQSKFSQFYNNKVSNNPAFTGYFNKSYRVSISTRTEKTNINNIITNNYFGVDGKVVQKFDNPFDVFSLGGALYNENNESNGLKSNNIFLASSFNKALDEQGKYQAIIGFSANFGRKELNTPQYVSASDIIDWVNQGYQIENIFSFQSTSFNYFDLNAGAAFQGALNDKHYFTIDAAINNVFARTFDFQNGKFKLEREYTFTGDFDLQTLNDQRINSNLLLIISKNKLLFFSTGLKYNMSASKFTKVVFGTWYKKFEKGDFLTPLIGVNYGKLNFNCSYDLNVSSSNLKRRGGFELSLIIIGAKNKENFLENRFIN